MRWITLSRLGLTVVLATVLPLLIAADDKPSGGIVIDKDKRTVTVPCKIAPRKIDDPAYKEIYPIEVVACWPFRKDPPGGQKAHETVVTFDFETKPSLVHKALEQLGLKPGKPVKGGEEEPQGPEVKILLEFTGADGAMKKMPAEKALVGPNPKFKMPPFKWRFTGSVMKQLDPTKPDKVYGADVSGTLISIFPVTDETVFQTQMTMKEEKFLKMETNKELLPKIGTDVKLIIEVPEAKK
jgi:hypothetical protein